MQFRNRIQTVALSLQSGSSGAVPDPTQHVLLPFKLGGRSHEVISTERNAGTLLEPLTRDHQEHGSFDPSTYREYWSYKDAVCPVTDTTSL